MLFITQALMTTVECAEEAEMYKGQNPRDTSWRGPAGFQGDSPGL